MGRTWGERAVEPEPQQAAVEALAPAESSAKPMCPRCGWSNTRLSFSHTSLDTLLQMFAFRAFRCRSCGNRFHAFHRAPRGE